MSVPPGATATLDQKSPAEGSSFSSRWKALRSEKQQTQRRNSGSKEFSGKGVSGKVTEKHQQSKKSENSLLSKATENDIQDQDQDLPSPARSAARNRSSQLLTLTPTRSSSLFGQSFGLPNGSPLDWSASSRSRHVPIVIPDYASARSTLSGALDDSESSFCSDDSDRLSVAEFLASTSPLSVSLSQPKTKHFEIVIPSWAHPGACQEKPPRISLCDSAFEPFARFDTLSPTGSTRSTLGANDHRIMASTSFTTNDLSVRSNRSVPQSNVTSANSSSTSLAGRHDNYESNSEAESTHNDENGTTRSRSQASGPSHAATASNGNSTHLSGLVCNVHRTTGKEPPPLVGATTTVLGDKLYVFGGRRLSRTKPQLTSNFYELDLIRRHWTKLELTGDIPPPRYFHSMCALGHTKLICYGGMSPCPTPAEIPEGSPEVIVMSDIHILDVQSKIWMKIATSDAPQGRYAHCAAVLPSSAVFTSANAPMSAVHHNPSGNNPNQGTLGVSLDGTGGAEMVVVGGQDSSNHYIEQISVFNLRSLKWTGTAHLGRSCGAYRSVVTPLTTLSASQIGAGPHARGDLDDEDDEPDTIGSGAPMLIYSNYNFLDVKLELQVRLMNGALTEKPMLAGTSPPGLRFPNGGIIANHFVVSGTFLTSSQQEYALWALDLRTLTWSRIDAGGSIFSKGSWNRGVLWNRRNAFVVLGNRKRNLVDDYNNRRINFTNICLVELESFGLYDNPRSAEPTSNYQSASAAPAIGDNSVFAAGRHLPAAAEDLGAAYLNARELADMDFLAIDGTRISVNSRLIEKRWGPHFTSLLRESVLYADADTATLRPSAAGHPSRNSSITITPSVSSGATTLTANTGHDTMDTSSIKSPARPRLFYLPHTAATIHALLHYLYTSNLPSPPDQLATPQIFCSLLQLARPYKIDGLLEAVVERLHESLDGRNAAAIFNAAAMGAGGGEGVVFASHDTLRHSSIPVRGAGSAGLDGLLPNGAGRANSLRVDTEMANGRSTRNTLRPNQIQQDESEDEVPNSATTDASTSDFEESSQGLAGRPAKRPEIWNGPMSAVVGLQKRGLRGLMEGRRLRERGKSNGQEAKVGLGIV